MIWDYNIENAHIYHTKEDAEFWREVFTCEIDVVKLAQSNN